MKPWRTETGGVMFGGWARMAIGIDSFTVIEVRKPNLGEKHPSRVRADIVVNLNVRKEVKCEWESLRRHDVCFLVTVRPACPPGTPYKYKEPFVPQVGLTYVRGCEIEGMLDPQGKILDETSLDKPFYNTDFRTLRVWLDCNQYKEDMDRTAGESDEDIYDTFNIIVRRKPKENNFKAVLETIRDLMNTECVVPEWLQEVVLGFGDPSAAHYTNMASKLSSIDFCDTFVDYQHLKDSFVGYDIRTDAKESSQLVPPFKIEFADEEEVDDKSDAEKGTKKSLTVAPYVLPNRGPYLVEQPKKNTALNALFEKIMALDIDERHLLRLGHGEESLETDKDFSRYGRVNYVLAKRIDLLNKVQHLGHSLGVESDVGYTCETAGYFYLYHVLSRWERYMTKVSADRSVETIEKRFPFREFFADAPQPLFTGQSFDEDLEVARGCYRYIRKIFTQLDEFKAFEMLRSGLDRSHYLLVREAKIIAMTCTHAALKRKELVSVGFQYDNILMEESAQILEIETFIPLLLQNPENGHNRLKRWIMIGDHHQLPPVIKNITFQKFSNMEQSLFTRFVRLGVPTIDLDAQGRARPSLCALYKWRYKNLGDLAHVSTLPEYQFANSGFRFDYQLINVDDYNGVGESEPVPYFYQNLAEAEYVVATFMYMRLMGYPSDKITILTTYNGQKHLIRDVVKQRCATNPFIGFPAMVNHHRDSSRANPEILFARVSLFQNCYELSNAFKLLMQRPQTLHLIPAEEYLQSSRKIGDITTDDKTLVVENMPQMVAFVYQFYQQKIDEWKTSKPEVFERLVDKSSDNTAAEDTDSKTVDETAGDEGMGEENDGEDDDEGEEELAFEKLTEDDTGAEDIAVDIEVTADQ
ncbi:unnamed protein product [Oppiella nova]|uniref:Intron-binding protein aquarius n=1 Tax=Oppiella nova TaxID=334625 RepID=A0A7R9LMK3_9ACAR|nr:unnamed protein product [Oppiella nova]CAG2165096.1 unnamed protein product [Oppiella nova]